MTHRAETLVLRPGVCRVCGCTETTPCTVPVDDGETGPCSWVDAAATLCTNPRCLAEFPLDVLLAMAWPNSIRVQAAASSRESHGDQA